MIVYILIFLIVLILGFAIYCWVNELYNWEKIKAHFSGEDKDSKSQSQYNSKSQSQDNSKSQSQDNNKPQSQDNSKPQSQDNSKPQPTNTEQNKNGNLSSIIEAKSIYKMPSKGSTFEEISKVCLSSNSRLATLDELNKARENGFYDCQGGYLSDGGLAWPIPIKSGFKGRIGDSTACATSNGQIQYYPPSDINKYDSKYGIYCATNQSAPSNSLLTFALV